MKFMFNSILTSSLLALAACGGQGDDGLGDNVAEAAEARSETLEEMAGNTTNEVQADALEQRAENVEELGAATEEAIDEADVQVNQQ